MIGSLSLAHCVVGIIVLVLIDINISVEVQLEWISVSSDFGTSEVRKANFGSGVELLVHKNSPMDKP